jgi:hypothetical protein
MAKNFEAFSSGFGELFDTQKPVKKRAKVEPVIKNGMIMNGMSAGLPVAYKEGVPGVELFGTWVAL